VASKASSLSEAELDQVGQAEDYLRVASNVSTTLEIGLALERGYRVSQIFSFASETMPLVASILVASGNHEAHVYSNDNVKVFTEGQLKALKVLGCNVKVHSGLPPAQRVSPDSLVLLASKSTKWTADAASVDGVGCGNILYILNEQKISEEQVLIRRKRMATPITTPVALGTLYEMAGLPAPASPSYSTADVDKFLAHLQTLSGAPVDRSLDPICFTAGLSTLASLWIALVANGGADVVMASTAYGGSSQLTDLIQKASSGALTKHTFDLQGARGMEQSIKGRLAEMASNAEKLKPTLVLFIETPTNPDMKVPDLKQIADMATEFHAKTGRVAFILVDATFAPDSAIIAKLRDYAPSVPVCIFLSMSKSVSRGMTTAGSFIFNQTPTSRLLHSEVLAAMTLIDAGAKPDQLKHLIDNHVGVEERCAKAYIVATAAGTALQAAIHKHRHVEMELEFVSPETAAKGFTTSTFSFNLPAVPGATYEVNAGLAQHFVDIIAKRKDLFKPCVSFGQDNGLIYATVPATSTQGAIKAEDKEKQAIGGVQLTRLSFPPTIDISEVNKVLANAVVELYAPYGPAK